MTMHARSGRGDGEFPPVEQLPPPVRAYWRRHTQSLLADISSMVSGSECSGPRDLAFHLPTIATWDCPGMERHIVRNADGELAEIRYSIASREVLRLVASMWEGGRFSPIRPFFAGPYGGFHLAPTADLTVGIYLLLDMWPAFYAQHAAGAAAMMERRMRIDAAVADALADLPLPHSLDHRGERPYLLVRLGLDAVLELQLPLAKDSLLGHNPGGWISRVAAACRESRLPFTLRGKSPGTAWGKTQEHAPELLAREQLRHGYREQWKGLIRGFLERDGGAVHSLEEVLGWRVPGMRMEALRDAAGRIVWVDAYLCDWGASDWTALRVGEGSVRLRLDVQQSFDWDGRGDLRGLMVALPSLVARMQREYAHGVSREGKVIRLVQASVREVVRQVPEVVGRPYMLRLFERVHLQVGMRGRRVLHFNVRYDDCPDFMVHLGGAIRQLDCLLEEVRAPFWVLGDAECRRRHPSAYAKLRRGE